MVNTSQLSVTSQAFLTHISSKDGDINNLSQADLLGASKEELKGFVQSLKQEGYDLNEQKLVETILRLTKDNIDFGKNQMKAVNLSTGALSMVSFVEDKAPEVVTNRGEVRKAVLAKSQLQEGSGIASFLVSNEMDASYFQSDWRINNALKARETLEKSYNFKPSNPFDLDAVKAFAKDNLSPSKVPGFINNYMAAYFEHPGKNTEWTAATEDEDFAEYLLFSNPSPLDTLPDGRRIIDCQGYCKVARLLFDAALPGKDHKRVFMLPIFAKGVQKSEEVANPLKKKGKAGENVAHELSFMRVGDDFYMQDNDQINKVTLTDQEVQLLEKLYDLKDSWNFDLRDIKIDKEQFPFLYNYFATDWSNWSDVELKWDENGIFK